MTAVMTKIKLDPYLKLVSEFPLRPIRTRKAHVQAAKRLRELQQAKDIASRDYKSVLVNLIADYEKAAGWVIDTSHVTAADVVRHLLDEHNLSVNAFARKLQMPQSSLSEMLSGKRAWSKSAIVKISKHFALNPSLFLK